MVFPVVIYGCETWTIRKAGRRRIDSFELWCWSKFLRVPWTAKRTNRLLQQIKPDFSLEGLILKQKLTYFGHIMRRHDSLEKTLMLGKIEGTRRGRPRMRWIDGITEVMDSKLESLQEIVQDRRNWRALVHRVTESRKRLNE